MRIRITGKRLPKAQTLGQVGGAKYYSFNRPLDPNNPVDAALIKQQEAGIADDQADIEAHFAQKAPRAMGQTISAQNFRTPPMAPTSMPNTFPNIQPVPQGPNWGNAIPVVNTNAAVYNSLMGIQPQVSGINQPNNFPNLTQAQGNPYLWGQQPTSGIIPQQPITRPNDPTQYAVDNTSGKDLGAANTMISQDAKNLQNTFNTGSAKDTKAGIANFNSTYGTNLKDPRMIKLGAKGRATLGAIGGASKALQAGIAVASAFTDYLGNQKKQKDFNSYMREQQMSDNLYPAMEGSRGDYVQTGSGFGEFRPDQEVVNKGMYTAAYGGTNYNDMKIRITGGPQHMEYGGQKGYGFDNGSKNVFTEMRDNSYDSVSNTIQEVPRDQANIEAEKGETVYGDIDGDGGLEHMNIGGKKHSEKDAYGNGGTPLNVPEGSFIFSKKLKEKDPETLKEFNKTFKKGGIPYADIAKQYDINKYKAIMEDPYADAVSKATAQLMVNNYEKKLAKLALAQEGSKGFPQGIPDIAQSVMPNQDMLMAAYGGFLPKAQFGALYAKNRTKAINAQKKVPQKTKNNSSDDVIYTPEFQKILAGLQNDQGYNMKYSPRVTAGDNRVPLMQGRQKTGLYGDIKNDEIAEFKQRHDWYFKDKPNWNPANKKDVLDFQTRYDNEFAKDNNYSYFTGKRKFDAKDSKLGEYTYNAPGLDRSPKQPDTKYKCGPNGVVAVRVDNMMQFGSFGQVGLFDRYEDALAACQGEKPEKPGDIPEIPEKLRQTPPDKTPFGWMTPDKVNLLAAGMNRPKKYLPWAANYNAYLPTPTFKDPNRELAANAEQANILTQGLLNFSDPQAYLANSSGIQGKALANAADIMARYQNDNVSIANQFAPLRADIKTKQGMYNAERATNLFNGNVIANQNFDNANRAYTNNLAKTFGNGWGNAMNLGMINTVNPMFNVDPRSGRSFFKNGYGNENLFTGPGSTGSDNVFLTAKNKFMSQGYSESMAEKKADALVSGPQARYTDTDFDGMPNRATYTSPYQNAQVFPPMYMNMLRS